MNSVHSLLEALESRQLLSATVTAKLSGHTLHVKGTKGADTIAVSESSGTLSVTSGGSSIYSGDATKIKAISISGGQGDDNVTIDSSVDVKTSITEGNGADTLTSNNGALTNIKVGNGNDDITGGDADFNVLPGSGADTITLGDGNEVVHNGKGADDITVGDGVAGDIIFVGAGDTLTAGTPGSYNIIISSAGADTITTGSGKDYVYLKPGNVFNGNANDIVFTGGDSSSNITGTSSSNVTVKYPKGFAAFYAKFLRYRLKS